MRPAIHDLGFSFAQSKAEVFGPFGAKAQDASRVYDPDGRLPLEALRRTVAMDQMMIEPPRFVSRQVSAQGIPAYLYRFSYVAESMRGEWPGAQHATELPYVFDTVQARYGEQLTDADRRTAEAANAYWANFARKRRPERCGSAGMAGLRPVEGHPAGFHLGRAESLSRSVESPAGPDRGAVGAAPMVREGAAARREIDDAPRRRDAGQEIAFIGGSPSNLKRPTSAL